MTPDTLTATAMPPVPLSVEGASVLHQMMRFRRTEWQALSADARAAILAEAIPALAALEHPAEGRQSALFDLVCRVIRPVVLLVEDCSPHACKLHWVAIRSNRAVRRKLWIREQRVKIGSDLHRPGPPHDPTRQGDDHNTLNSFNLAGSVCDR